MQIEYSPFTTDIEDPKIGLLAACRELGVAVVAYSPLARGLLSGHVPASAQSLGASSTGDPFHIAADGEKEEEAGKRKVRPEASGGDGDGDGDGGDLGLVLDVRKFFPRFSPENLPKNLAIVAELRRMAEDEKGCTAAQLALAWLLYQGDDIFPIPG